jgi:hypothetical protein
VSAELYCCECGCPSAASASGWRCYIVDIDDDGRDEVVLFCPVCAAREFGARAAVGRIGPVDPDP